MFVGGILGGLAGARWHTKLENRVYDEEIVEDGRVVDVTDGRPATTPVQRGGAAAAPPPPAATTSSYSTNSGTTRDE
jgi:hypothetical protein